MTIYKRDFIFMGVLDDIYDTGDDALSYDFDISISPITILLTSINGFLEDPLKSDINLRTQSVTIPEISTGLNTIKYDGYSINKPNASRTTNYTFSFDLRIDKYWPKLKYNRTNYLFPSFTNGMIEDGDSLLSSLIISMAFFLRVLFAG